MKDADSYLVEQPPDCAWHDAGLTQYHVGDAVLWNAHAWKKPVIGVVIAIEPKINTGNICFVDANEGGIFRIHAVNLEHVNRNFKISPLVTGEHLVRTRDNSITVVYRGMDHASRRMFSEGGRVFALTYSEFKRKNIQGPEYGAELPIDL
jgi:hypothetical protein